jgi:hypothetical protein
MRWAEHVARMGKNIKAYRVLLGSHEGRSPLQGLLIHRSILLKTDGKEIGSGVVGLNNLGRNEETWRAFVNTVMKIQAPSNVRNFPTRCTRSSF